MPWRDKEYSERLPGIRLGGETQEVEFKRQWPDSADDIAKEIAAFASSNRGIILIGVADDGSLVGLEEAATAPGRGELIQRIQGMSRSSISPAITPRVMFAEEAGLVVMIVEVPKGEEPVYYVRHRPCVRHLTEARFAQPAEVVALVKAWLERKESGNPSPQQIFLSSLFSFFAEILLWNEEVDSRQINP